MDISKTTFRIQVLKRYNHIISNIFNVKDHFFEIFESNKKCDYIDTFFNGFILAQIDTLQLTQDNQHFTKFVNLPFNVLQNLIEIATTLDIFFFSLYELSCLFDIHKVLNLNSPETQFWIYMIPRIRNLNRISQLLKYVLILNKADSNQSIMEQTNSYTKDVPYWIPQLSSFLINLEQTTVENFSDEASQTIANKCRDQFRYQLLQDLNQTTKGLSSGYEELRKMFIIDSNTTTLTNDIQKTKDSL